MLLKAYGDFQYFYKNDEICDSFFISKCKCEPKFSLVFSDTAGLFTILTSAEI